MKKILMTTSSLLFAGLIAFAAMQVPDFKNTPMAVNADGSLLKLEKQAGEKKSKSGGGPFMYYGAGNAQMDYMQFPEIASTAKVSPDTKFIVKVDADVDPETLFKLTSMVVNKKNKMREVYTKKSTGRSVKDAYIGLSYEKVSEGVYKITPATSLVSGTEYCFLNENSSTVFLFGVK